MLGLGLLLSALLLLLLTPWVITIHVRRGKSWAAQVSVRWGVLPLPAGRPAHPPRRPAPPRPRSARRPPNLRRVRALLSSEDFVASFVRLARRMLHMLRPTDVKVWARVGLEDPAATGWLCGALAAAPLTGVLRESACIEVEPAFEGSVLEVDARATVTVVPLTLGGVLLGYALTPAPWRAAVSFARA